MRKTAGAFAALLVWSTAAALAAPIVLTPIGTFSTGIFNEGGAEIVAHDPATQRVFVVNAQANRLDVLDIRFPWAPTRINTIDLSPHGGGVNSVAVHDGVIAAAVENTNKQAPGKVAFFDAAGNLLSSVTVGALPDMLTFSPDGSWVLVANEGEPLDYCAPGLANDPEGSVSVIDLRGGVASLTQAQVRTAGFTAFNGGVPAGIRIFGPNATVAQDLEPEYIAISPDSTTAWVTLQENNALAVIDIASATVTSLVPLGTKDHSLPRNALDPSDRDGGTSIAPWPVRGLFMPDAVASYSFDSQPFLVLANEGDARDYECFGEETRVGNLDLEAAMFPGADALQENELLGRLRTTTAGGDTDGDGENEEIHTFGARSFSIRDATGALVWDSGNELELLTAAALPGVFNSTNDENGSADTRSDDKGPEPEGVALGLYRGRMYAFIGLERIGGVMVYDVTNPHAPFFVQYVNPRHFDGDAEAGSAGDLGPEGLVYIPRDKSPIPRALLVVGNEISGTVTIYSIKPRV
jgi:hypothetical protein